MHKLSFFHYVSLGLLLTPIYLFLSFSPTFAHEGTNQPGCEGTDSLGGQKHLTHWEACSNESRLLEHHVCCNSDEEALGSCDDRGNWQGGVCRGTTGGPTVPTPSCGDGYCDTSTGELDSCPQDCGRRIAGNPNCNEVESDSITVALDKNTPSVNIEPTEGQAQQLRRYELGKVAAGSFDLYRNLRPGYMLGENLEEKFQAPDGKVLIEGKIPLEGNERVPNENRIGLLDNFYLRYNSISTALKSFLKPPNIRAALEETNPVTNTNAPSENLQAEGKITIPWGSRLGQLASGIWNRILNIFGGRTTINQEIKIVSCTTKGRENFQNALEINSFAFMPNIARDYRVRKDDKIPTSVKIKPNPATTISQDVGVSYYATKSLREINDQVKKSLAFFPSTSAIGVSVPSALPTLSSVVPGTTLVIERVNQNIQAYKEAAREYNLPWQMLAAIHFREGSNERNDGVYNGHGICRIDNDRDPARGRGTFYHCGNGPTFENDAKDAARHVIGKVTNLIRQGKIAAPLDYDPSNNDSESIKWAFYGYNGTGYGPTYVNSPYVMNNWDRTGMIISGYLPGGAYVERPDTRDGAWKVYVLLVNATYRDDGTIERLNTR